jgi:hypothetical protein
MKDFGSDALGKPRTRDDEIAPARAIARVNTKSTVSLQGGRRPSAPRQLFRQRAVHAVRVRHPRHRITRKAANYGRACPAAQCSTPTADMSATTRVTNNIPPYSAGATGSSPTVSAAL